MTAHGVGGIFDGCQAAVGGPEVPLLQEGLCHLERLIPELLKVHPNVVGTGGFKIQLFDLEGIESCCLIRLEITRILQPEIPGSFQLRTILLLLAPHFIHGLIEDLQDMELVKSQVSFRKVILYALDERRRHIAANLPDV